MKQKENFSKNLKNTSIDDVKCVKSTAIFAVMVISVVFYEKKLIEKYVNFY
jgi:hypothetical protein